MKFTLACPTDVCSLHHIVFYIACDIAYDVSFDSNWGVRIACTEVEWSDSCSDCFIAATLPVLLQQPDSIAMPCFPIPPRPANPLPPRSCLPPAPAFSLCSLGCNPAHHAENCGMLCRYAATTTDVRPPPSGQHKVRQAWICDIADPWIAVHARMIIRINRRG
jgi:hypothetical protein